MNIGMLKYVCYDIYLDLLFESNITSITGLRSILFAVNIDSSQLNSPFKQPSLPRENAALAPMESKDKNDSKSVIPNQALDDPSIINKKKRKKKVKQATIEDIEFPEDEPPSEMYLKPGSQNFTTSTVPKKKSDNADKTAEFSSSVNARRPLPMEVKSAMTHRRATSLESSEIIRQKLDRHKNGLESHIDCEVNPSGSHGIDATRSDRRNEVIGKQANELNSKETDMNEEVDSKEDPEYSNILSKLANLSTSFKSSLSMGFFQRDEKRKGDSIGEAVSGQHDDSNDYKDLLDDENDVISSTSKLEMQQGVIESLNDEKGRQFYKNHTADKDGKNVSKNENTMYPSHNAVEETSRVVEIEAPLPTNKDSDLRMKHSDELHAMAVLNGKSNIIVENTRTGGDVDKTTHPTIAERVKEIENCSIVDSSKMDTSNQDDIDRLSVNSSNAGSASNDSDTLQPVGFESEKFLSMNYDIQSSKAANDALQLLKTSVDISFLDNEYGGEKDDQYKSLPKQYTSSRTTDSSYVGDLTKEELKEAILATVKRKDEFEEQNRVLQLALDEERECTLSLKAEVETLSEKVGELQETSSRQTADLSRENEILRNQLKKYVAAVQLLKRENKNISTETNDAISTLRGYSDDSEVILPPQLKERVESEMDSIYEEKLIQMSQLHGELMEFHEMLQRNLVKKEKIMTKMKEELVCLRGPLPDDIDETNEDCEREHRPLINVWIPSVFTQGKGSDAHHLYQIYIRIGDEEWNIYRRYSQFHRLHMLSSKAFQGVENLNFPPKKIIGKKDLKFVEGRRKKLQNYLRKLINISLANDRLLSESPCKENLENSLPFFSDETYSDGKKRKENNKNKSKKPAVYTGL